MQCYCLADMSQRDDGSSFILVVNMVRINDGKSSFVIAAHVSDPSSLSFGCHRGKEGTWTEMKIATV